MPKVFDEKCVNSQDCILVALGLHYIPDSQCADMASHDNMMKGEGATNAKECTIACVKKGGTYSLYVSAAKQSYKLDNQKKAAAFAGQKVTVTGSVDSSGDSIKVANIQAQ